MNELASEIRTIPPSAELARSGKLRVLLRRAHQIPGVMREIGRLREIAFRAAGEGTGRELDLDRFDETYDQMFLWNDERSEVIGGYRLKRTAGCSLQDLYSARQFGYCPPDAVELGRSFVRVEYQREYLPLLLLWKGIGAYLTRHPKCRYLFGAVSISRTYSDAERAAIVRYLNHREQAAPKMPVLLRQYLGLGAKLIATRVDPEFSNVLDALMIVDLAQTEARLLRRCLPAQAA